MKRFGKAAIVMITAATAWAAATGAFAEASRQQQQYAECVRDSGGGRVVRMNCCKAVEGTWIEIYDDKGNIISEGCTADNGNDLDDGSLGTVSTRPTIAPGVLDSVVTATVASAPAATPTPASTIASSPADAGSGEEVAAESSDGAPAAAVGATDGGSGEELSGSEAAATDPAPAPAPEKVKKHKKHRHHPRHH